MFCQHHPQSMRSIALRFTTDPVVCLAAFAGVGDPHSHHSSLKRCLSGQASYANHHCNDSSARVLCHLITIGAVCDSWCLLRPDFSWPPQRVDFVFLESLCVNHCNQQDSEVSLVQILPRAHQQALLNARLSSSFYSRVINSRGLQLALLMLLPQHRRGSCRSCRCCDS